MSIGSATSQLGYACVKILQRADKILVKASLKSETG